jgi:hypothetical protein
MPHEKKRSKAKTVEDKPFSGEEVRRIFKYSNVCALDKVLGIFGCPRVVQSKSTSRPPQDKRTCRKTCVPNQLDISYDILKYETLLQGLLISSVAPNVYFDTAAGELIRKLFSKKLSMPTLALVDEPLYFRENTVPGNIEGYKSLTEIDLGYTQNISNLFVTHLDIKLTEITKTEKEHILKSVLMVWINEVMFVRHSQDKRLKTDFATISVLGIDLDSIKGGINNPSLSSAVKKLQTKIIKLQNLAGWTQTQARNTCVALFSKSKVNPSRYTLWFPDTTYPGILDNIVDRLRITGTAPDFQSRKIVLKTGSIVSNSQRTMGFSTAASISKLWAKMLPKTLSTRILVRLMEVYSVFNAATTYNHLDQRFQKLCSFLTDNIVFNNDLSTSGFTSDATTIVAASAISIATTITNFSEDECAARLAHLIKQRLGEYTEGLEPTSVHLTMSGLSATALVVEEIFQVHGPDANIIILPSVYFEIRDMVIGRFHSVTVLRTSDLPDHYDLPIHAIFADTGWSLHISLRYYGVVNIAKLVKTSSLVQNAYIVIDETVPGFFEKQRRKKYMSVLEDNRELCLRVTYSLQKVHSFGMDRLSGGTVACYGSSSETYPKRHAMVKLNSVGYWFLLYYMESEQIEYMQRIQYNSILLRESIEATMGKTLKVHKDVLLTHTELWFSSSLDEHKLDALHLALLDIGRQTGTNVSYRHSWGFQEVSVSYIPNCSEATMHKFRITPGIAEPARIVAFGHAVGQYMMTHPYRFKKIRSNWI